MHDCGMRHGDIEATNVLIYKSTFAALVDFDTVAFMEEPFVAMCKAGYGVPLFICDINKQLNFTQSVKNDEKMIEQTFFTSITSNANKYMDTMCSYGTSLASLYEVIAYALSVAVGCKCDDITKLVVKSLYSSRISYGSYNKYRDASDLQSVLEKMPVTFIEDVTNEYGLDKILCWK